MRHILIPLFVLATLAIAVCLIFMLNQDRSPAPTQVSSSKPKVIEHYQAPKIKPSAAYTIILVGDSMTDYLGENSDYLRKYLGQYYPEKTFGIFNYGFGATNILTVDERLEHETTYVDKTFPAILSREFDVIIIESFGHNPLSDYSLERGLKKQNEALDNIVYKLVTQKPNSVIIFLATLAPSEKYYAKGVVDLSDEQRKAWVAERKAYIENHISYAKKHNIPLIDVYHASLMSDGDIDITLVNSDDYIHPSATGADLISKSIADYLYQNNILPAD